MFEPISTIIKKNADKFSFKRKTSTADVIELWPIVIEELFGKEATYFSKAFVSQEGVIEVKTGNDNLRQELEAGRERIIFLLNKKAKEELIKDIIFKD